MSYIIRMNFSCTDHDAFCRFSIDMDINNIPAIGDELVFEYQDDIYYYVVNKKCHFEDGTCSIVCFYAFETEYAMVEAFDVLKMKFGDSLTNVEVSGRPPRYYKLYRQVKQMWGPIIKYDDDSSNRAHDISILSEIIRSIVVVNSGVDPCDLNDSIEDFANFLIREFQKNNKNIYLLKCMAAWSLDIECEYEASDDEINDVTKLALSKFKKLNKDRLSDRLVGLID